MTFPSPEWSALIRRKLSDPTFTAAVGALDASAAGYRTDLPPHPSEQAGYYHDFFCPEHAVQLVFDPHESVRHKCPVDGAVFTGEPFSSAWLWSVNDLLSDAALRLALSSFLRGETVGDAARATAILAGYAASYGKLPRALKSHPTHPGIVTFTGLDESVWVIRIAWAYALLRGRMSAADDRLIREALLSTAAEHILRIRWPEVHNATNWNNAALATVGLAIGEERFVEAALGGPVGLEAELAEGVLADGLWWEVSLSYHYYALAAIVWTFRAFAAAGRQLKGDETVRRMFHAPLALAYPDLSLPAVDDCWYSIGLTGLAGHGIPDAAGFYETAWARHRDPEFAWVLEQNYASRPRNGLEVLLDGAERIAGARAPRRASEQLADSGLAVLRTGDRADESCLIFKAGPDGGTHGHPDQLAIQLFAAGSRLAPDLGTAGYGIDLNDGWYRQSASHSTVLLDGQSQPPASGRLQPLHTDGDHSLACGSVEWRTAPYEGVRMQRTVIGCERYFIDCFEVSAPRQRTVDWIYLNRGRLVGGLDGAKPRRDPLGDDCGYRYLSQQLALRPPSGPLSWEVENARLELYLAPEATEELVAGTAPGNPAADTLAAVIRRRQAQRVLFRALLAPSRRDDKPWVRAVRWLESGALEVETAGGIDRWEIAPDLRSVRRTTLPLSPGESR